MIQQRHPGFLLQSCYHRPQTRTQLASLFPDEHIGSYRQDQKWACGFQMKVNICKAKKINNLPSINYINLG